MDQLKVSLPHLYSKLTTVFLFQFPGIIISCWPQSLLVFREFADAHCIRMYARVCARICQHAVVWYRKETADQERWKR